VPGTSAWAVQLFFPPKGSRRKRLEPKTGKSYSRPDVVEKDNDDDGAVFGGWIMPSARA
jgi:hypothetical protein